MSTKIFVCLTTPIGSMENINGPYPQKNVIQYISYANSCNHNCAFFFASITMHMCINVPIFCLLLCVCSKKVSCLTSTDVSMYLEVP